MWTLVALLASGVVPPPFSVAAEPELLDPEKAFRISTRTLGPKHVEVRFAIAEGYYVYRDRFRFETAAGRLLADVQLPKGKMKDDPFFGRTEIYRGEVRIRVPLAPAEAARGNVKLKITSQGCADVGVCYVPLVQWIEVRLQGGSSSAPAASIRQEPLGIGGLPKTPPEDASVVPQGASR